MGIWRAEDERHVKEIALRGDHSFTSWLDYKNILTTPGCIVHSGNWQLHGRQIVVHLTDYDPSDSRDRKDRQISLTIVKFTNETLLIKEPEETAVLTYKRLFSDYNPPPSTAAPTDADLVGTWRFHYNTHDYEVSLSQDRRYAVSAQVPPSGLNNNQAERLRLWEGTWQLRNGKLVIDAKLVPASQGQPVETMHRELQLIGVDPQRIVLQEGPVPVPYVLQRLK